MAKGADDLLMSAQSGKLSWTDLYGLNEYIDNYCLTSSERGDRSIQSGRLLIFKGNMGNPYQIPLVLHRILVRISNISLKNQHRQL